jgi:hypothetical protein
VPSLLKIGPVVWRKNRKCKEIKNVNVHRQTTDNQKSLDELKRRISV